MTQKYDVESLISTFEEHAKQYEDQKEQWKKKNGKEMPHSDFNLPKAFLCILKEIKELKDA